MDNPNPIKSLINLSISSPRPDLGDGQSCTDMNDFLWDTRHDLTVNPAVMRTFAGLYSTIILLGVLGNSCVIIAIARIKSLQTVPNMFIFSLSCSDILVCCISATITPITAFRKDWVFGPFLCSTAPFIAGVSLCFSTFTLAAISVDRFMLIIFPTRKAFSHGQALAVIMTICLLASAFSLPVIFMQKLKSYGNYCGEFCFEDWGHNDGIRRIYGTLLLTVQFIIPLALIIFCYTAISLRLGKSVNLRHKKTECEWQMPVSAQRNAATKRRQRTNRMFIAMVIAFSLSWVWSVLYNLLRDYQCLPDLVTQQEFFFGILTHCIAMSSTVWNPVLYALLNLQLRAAFIQLIPQCIKNALITVCGKAKTGGGDQRSSLEESRLLGTLQCRNGVGRSCTGASGKKWLNCFVNSDGSVESSTSDGPRGVTAVKMTNGGNAAEKTRLKNQQQQNGTPKYGSGNSWQTTETTLTMSGGVEVMQTAERSRLMRCEEEPEGVEGEEEEGAVIEELDTDERI